MDIPNKVFVVTGAGNGIGREVSRQLLVAGASVAGVDLSEAGLKETARLANAGGRFSAHVVNITDREAVEALPPAVETVHGRVDGLINVAGVIQKFVKVNDLPFAEIEKVMNVNFWGTIYMCKAFLPTLLSRPAAALVNIASMGAYAPVPGQAVYGASKAAVKILTEALYAELLDTNVSVTVVFPGAIGTDIAANSGVALGDASAEAPAFKTTAPADAAKVIVDAVRKGKFRATIGADAATMDRLSRLSPKHATTMIAKQMGALLN
ncbi:SDR family oxidoreductase [Microbacterium trichothecenolyticum]|uniref:SDR family oxidoreductase n=1 Tax=Microbacterium ureisolvens TaxID=2781186 RepID=A0ABS7HYY4_9MICO|nr:MULTISPECIES: SDR family oxidoreductase [Microbacterium]MBW9110350.1 SDR family oxidoreductase [Microbacterium ureisolvens]MBW9120453.1 SDR family oxidoreductase [Microbacterium trichothecenolyticum]